MRFENIYQSTIDLWPHEIFIGDGQPLNNGGYLFPELSRAWKKAEADVLKQDDWKRLMLWSMFQTFHHASIQLVSDGETTLRPRGIEPSQIEDRFFLNLQKGPDWRALLSEYERE
jgi:hypothetical protein